MILHSTTVSLALHEVTPPLSSKSLYPDDEIQPGTSVLADEPKAGTRVKGASGVDSRVGSPYFRREVQVNIRAASLPGMHSWSK